MKQTFIACLLVVALYAASCASKKPVASAPPSPPPPPVPLVLSPPAPEANVPVPADAELAAAQSMFPDITMQTLTEGYSLYTGVCAKCHPAKNIYKRPMEAWPHIIEDMAVKAKITQAEKEAVFKYVVAVKSTQPKENR